MNSSVNNLSTKVFLAEVADMKTELECVQRNVEKDREDLMKELKNISDEFQEYKIRHDDIDYQISTMNELRQVGISIYFYIQFINGRFEDDN